MSNTSFYGENVYVKGDRPKHSVSSVDMLATVSIVTPENKTLQITLGTLSVVAISEMRDTFPVSVLSTIAPVGFTRGHRITAGSLVFSVFDRGSFSYLVDADTAPAQHNSVQDALDGTGSLSFYDTPADALPPFDIHMVYNSDGIMCYEGLRGVRIVNQGMGRSMESAALQESYSFLAQERIPLQPFELYAKAKDSKVYKESINPLAGKYTPAPLLPGDLVTPTLGPFAPLTDPQALSHSVFYTQRLLLLSASNVPVSGVQVICDNQKYISDNGIVTLYTPTGSTFPIQILGTTAFGIDGSLYRTKDVSMMLSPGTAAVDVTASAPPAKPVQIAYD